MEFRNILLALFIGSSNAFTASSPARQRFQTTSLQSAVASSLDAANTRSDDILTYQHKDWTLTYRYKPAARGHETDEPVVLVHPVGIGLSSWFWDKFFDQWEGGPLYAPDLIGCGIHHGADVWNPDERGLSFPLGWAQGCEALFDKIRKDRQSMSWPSFVQKPTKCVVLAQGGLAPVGLMIASRNPKTVSKLVLTSPPTWEEMTKAIPEKELETNYNFLRNPIWGKLAFSILESRWAIEFFSNLFLFEGKSDKEWLDAACLEGSYPESRPPVMAFNAGFCNARSFEEELTELKQPTLILQGQDDAARISKRQEYVERMPQCTLQTLPGKNILPWESPAEVARALQSFR